MTEDFDTSNMPEAIMVWRSMPNLSHIGTWATERYPVEAKSYTCTAATYERGRIAGLREAGQICLDRASGCHAVVAADAEGQLEGAYEDILALIP